MALYRGVRGDAVADRARCIGFAGHRCLTLGFLGAGGCLSDGGGGRLLLVLGGRGGGGGRGLGRRRQPGDQWWGGLGLGRRGGRGRPLGRCLDGIQGGGRGSSGSRGGHGVDLQGARPPLACGSARPL
jgi:hypothetical protein